MPFDEQPSTPRTRSELLKAAQQYFIEHRQELHDLQLKEATRRARVETLRREMAWLSKERDIQSRQKDIHMLKEDCQTLDHLLSESKQSGTSLSIFSGNLVSIREEKKTLMEHIEKVRATIDAEEKKRKVQELHCNELLKEKENLKHLLRQSEYAVIPDKYQQVNIKSLNHLLTPSSIAVKKLEVDALININNKKLARQEELLSKDHFPYESGTQISPASESFCDKNLKNNQNNGDEPFVLKQLNNNNNAFSVAVSVEMAKEEINRKNEEITRAKQRLVHVSRDRAKRITTKQLDERVTALEAQIKALYSTLKEEFEEFLLLSNIVICNTAEEWWSTREGTVGDESIISRRVKEMCHAINNYKSVTLQELMEEKFRLKRQLYELEVIEPDSWGKEEVRHMHYIMALEEERDNRMIEFHNIQLISLLLELEWSGRGKIETDAHSEYSAMISNFVNIAGVDYTLMAPCMTDKSISGNRTHQATSLPDRRTNKTIFSILNSEINAEVSKKSPTTNITTIYPHPDDSHILQMSFEKPKLNKIIESTTNVISVHPVSTAMVVYTPGDRNSTDFFTSPTIYRPTVQSVADMQSLSPIALWRLFGLPSIATSIIRKPKSLFSHLLESKHKEMEVNIHSKTYYI
eukprot:Tbor_TRINITY_DN3035_c0_g1::TRINITY_DN3035_c0_g1_i1::g.17298::m.17298